MAEVNKKNQNADFNEAADVNLTMDQLSYICEYCGKVNGIASASCVRCGKRRPRSEYLKAMERLEKAKTLQDKYVAEKLEAEDNRAEEIEKEVERRVSQRLAEERAQIQAQSDVKREQEIEEIKKSTARDAVLRVVAAENAADERVNEVEARTDELLREKNKELDEYIAGERERALNAAAERVVAERAGIEQAAKEKIEQNREATERYATERIISERDEAERIAARQAVLQIISAEQIADEKLRLSKNAIHQAAVERIVQERMLADKEAATRYAAEKQAIERAADERIRAEREAARRLIEGRYPQQQQPAFGYQQPVAYNYQQPFTVVPYVNANQPVYQYNPTRTIYKFVPDAQAEPATQINQLPAPEVAPVPEEGKKRKKRR